MPSFLHDAVDGGAMRPSRPVVELLARTLVCLDEGIVYASSHSGAFKPLPADDEQRLNVITYPYNWDERAKSVMWQAAALAGLKKVHFLAEPIAGALGALQAENALVECVPQACKEPDLLALIHPCSPLSPLPLAPRR